MQHSISKRHRLAALATAAGLAFTLAACSSDADASGASSSGERLDNGDLKTVHIGIHSGWDEGIAVSHLFKVVLEDQGYTVKADEAEAGLVFAGLAGGDFDVNFDMWLPNTHADYDKQYGDDMEKLGDWYDDAKLTIAVNKDAPIDSLDELADHADEFDNRIVGIESGAGLTRITQDQAIPDYGLDKMDFLVSSTPAMLAELKGATAAGKNIVVTLWRPHWAYDEYPIKDLKDPKGSMGDAEKIYSVGRTGFSKDYPTLSSWIKGFNLDDDQLFSLENAMFNSGDETDPDDAARAWLKDNPTFVDDLESGSDA